MVISFGTVTHEGTLGRHLHRRVEHGEVSETDSSRSIGFQFSSLIPFFWWDTQCVDTCEEGGR